MIELYKDGDSMGILTDAKNEDEFIDEISELFGNLIDDGEYENDWEFQFNFWLPQIVEICCKYRGYKANVSEQKVIICGGPFLGDNKPVHVLNRRIQHNKALETDSSPKARTAQL